MSQNKACTLLVRIASLAYIIQLKKYKKPCDKNALIKSSLEVIMLFDFMNGKEIRVC